MRAFKVVEVSKKEQERKESGHCDAVETAFSTLLAASSTSDCSFSLSRRQREKKKKKPIKNISGKRRPLLRAFACFCLLARENVSYRDVDDKEGRESVLARAEATGKRKNRKELGH
jgi:hypothetical protein